MKASRIPQEVIARVPDPKPDHLDRVSATQRLAEAGCISAREEADELVRAAGGDPGVLEDLVSRRTNGEPIAWLTGGVTVCGVELFVAPGVYVRGRRPSR